MTRSDGRAPPESDLTLLGQSDHERRERRFETLRGWRNTGWPASGAEGVPLQAPMVPGSPSTGSQGLPGQVQRSSP
jgi:hypothetical protein